MSINHNSITVSNGIRIIDIFLVPNALHRHKEQYGHPCMDLTVRHNDRCRRLALPDEWQVSAGELSVEIWAVGSPYDCQEPDRNSNLTDHCLDEDLRERIRPLLDTDTEMSVRFLQRLPVRMLQNVIEGDVVEMIPGVLSARFVQLPYRYRTGTFQDTLNNLIIHHSCSVA